MKKRNLKNLGLQKITISNLDANRIKAGEAASHTLWNTIIVCVTRWTNEDCPSLTCPNEK